MKLRTGIVVVRRVDLRDAGDDVGRPRQRVLRERDVVLHPGLDRLQVALLDAGPPAVRRGRRALDHDLRPVADRDAGVLRLGRQDPGRRRGRGATQHAADHGERRYRACVRAQTLGDAGFSQSPLHCAEVF